MYTCHPDIIVTKSPLLRITGDVGGILRTRPRLIDKIQYTANNPSATDVSDHVKPPLSSRINNGPLKMLATPWIKLYRSRNSRSAIYFFLYHVLCKDSIPFQAAFKYLTMYHPGKHARDSVGAQQKKVQAPTFWSRNQFVDNVRKMVTGCFDD